MFSKKCEYGIRATILIAGESLKGQRISLKYISEQIGSPNAFTAKILQTLTRAGLVDSQKGPTGGFEIPIEKLSQITLHDIVEALDGSQIYNGCGLGLAECSEDHPCPIHEHFKLVRADLKAMAHRANLLDLSTGLIKGFTYLKTACPKKIKLVKDKKVLNSTTE
ncbi:Rrf2 family transcriptional regulator [Litoribacter alkaliphilus]|uniref:Rrf2 family transcriptional regulator n=1 Tax=Litoribacter ruber TaxID=702568 RepID=A0AAP2CGV0_9BACT|nr:Rrf2 family transcriptional regulator [Litoribacter alkaliphilus]MBS9524473.1 Rrf2 family transcriptional regulator [Litoribacter alkaliphilus]